MMRRNCNLDLSLVPSSASMSMGINGNEEISNSNPQEQEQEPMTIFYNGRICVYDVTELQARSIIWFASRKTKESMSRSPVGETQILPPMSQSNKLCSPTGVSMKSLRQFLEKRRRRIQATSPYHHGFHS